MWGEASNAIEITSTLNTNPFGTITLQRSIARIELGVNIENTDGTDIFEILEVKAYNAHEKGYAYPLPENLENGKAKLPSLVDDVFIDPVNMVYGNEFITDNQLTGSIYVNEASNQDAGIEDAFFLIIKALYKGGDANPAPTYYKVGFYNHEDKPVDILRNFTYNITITAVNGPGEEDEEKAVKSISKNLVVAFTNWSDGKMKHVVFNGQYYLAVSESNMLVPKAAGDHSFFSANQLSSGMEG
ncbi:MAG: hypothetical protein LIP01_07965 [Tannerellaceae bacterium]|nr:hypothetical protein [Tannerellaceae bacterium]